MVALTAQYTAFVFVAAVGVIQIAAANAGLNGLFLTFSRRSAILLGVFLLIASFAWFFGFVDRNTRGLEGAEQTLLFIPGAIAAVVATVIVSSLLHRFHLTGNASASSQRRGHRRTSRENGRRGLDALRYMGYLDVLSEMDETEDPTR